MYIYYNLSKDKRTRLDEGRTGGVYVYKCLEKQERNYEKQSFGKKVFDGAAA